VTDDVVVEV